jgi:hypothetical protein
MMGELAVAAPQVNFEIGGGYRVDDLDWNIASDITGTATPNILSELSWDKLHIFQLKANVNVLMRNGLFLKGYGRYGESFKGSNQDSDFFGNKRTFEFSRSNNDGEGDFLDAGVGIGYRFIYYDKLVKKNAYLTPQIGYSRHEQNLKITNGVQVLPLWGPFPGLNSTYDAEWEGLWLGMDMLLEYSRNTDYFINFQYHLADYSAKANWNLRTDFMHPVSFDQTADGTGFTVSIGILLKSKKRWLHKISWDIESWKADAGVDRVFFSDGTIALTRLNEVNWRSIAINYVANFRF